MKPTSLKPQKVKFSQETKFLGRNGFYRCTGLEISPMTWEEIHIEPITSKGLVGRCKLIIPKADATSIAENILLTANSKTKVCTFIEASSLIPKGWAEKGFWDLVTNFSYGDNNRSLVTASDFARHCEEALDTREDEFSPSTATRFLKKLRALGETYIDLEN